VLLTDAGIRRSPPTEVLSPGAIRTLAALNLLHELERVEIARPCLGIIRQWGDSPERDDFLRAAGAKGWIVDREAFDELLAGRACNAGARWLHARLVDLSGVAGAWQLHLRDQSGSRLVRAGFVVDASGRARAVGRRLGAAAQRTAQLIATWREPSPDSTSPAPAEWLEVRAEEGSWTYTLVGPRGGALTVEVTSAPTSPKGGSKRASACGQLSSACAGPGWAAVGDAAAAYDPITGQGLGHALGSALALVAALDAALSDPTDARGLDAYSAAVHSTFRRSAVGARYVYGVGAERLGGAFWHALAN
jgi:flavin-dependent dehydrogenase